jgi:hypothetical protein
MNIEGDIAALLDVDIFGVSARVTLAGQTVGRTIPGIYDDAYEAVDARGGVPFAVSSPRFVAATADLPSGTKEGDALRIGSTNYTIRVVQADGTGITTLMLEKT